MIFSYDGMYPRIECAKLSKYYNQARLDFPKFIWIH